MRAPITGLQARGQKRPRRRSGTLRAAVRKARRCATDTQVHLNHKWHVVFRVRPHVVGCQLAKALQMPRKECGPQILTGTDSSSAALIMTSSGQSLLPPRSLPGSARRRAQRPADPPGPGTCNGHPRQPEKSSRISATFVAQRGNAENRGCARLVRFLTSRIVRFSGASIANRAASSTARSVGPDAARLLSALRSSSSDPLHCRTRPGQGCRHGSLTHGFLLGLNPSLSLSLLSSTSLLLLLALGWFLQCTCKRINQNASREGVKDRARHRACAALLPYRDSPEISSASFAAFGVLAASPSPSSSLPSSASALLSCASSSA